MKPSSAIILLLAVVPLLEIYVLLEVGGVVGALPTVFLVVFTAVLGMLLVRWQGLATLGRLQRALSLGQLPALEMMEAVMLLLSGALLLTPGFVTDSLGFLLLIPGVRRGLIAYWLRTGMARGFRPEEEETRSRVIEGQYRRRDE